MALSSNLTAIASAKDTYTYLAAGIAAGGALGQLSAPHRLLEVLRKLGTPVRRIPGTDLRKFEFEQRRLRMRKFGHLRFNSGHFGHCGYGHQGSPFGPGSIIYICRNRDRGRALWLQAILLRR